MCGCVGVRGCARVCVDVCGCARVCVGVAGVSGFSNNYEFSEYFLETNVFMQWPLIRILFEFCHIDCTYQIGQNPKQILIVTKVLKKKSKK